MISIATLASILVLILECVLRGDHSPTSMQAPHPDTPLISNSGTVDPFQLGNLVNKPEYASVQTQLEDRLSLLLEQRRDEFLSGPGLVARSGYVVDPKNETVDYNLPFNPANITKSPIGS